MKDKMTMVKQRSIYLTYEYTIFIIMLTNFRIFSQFLCWFENKKGFWSFKEARLGLLKKKKKQKKKPFQTTTTKTKKQKNTLFSVKTFTMTCRLEECGILNALNWEKLRTKIHNCALLLNILAPFLL